MNTSTPGPPDSLHQVECRHALSLPPEIVQCDKQIKQFIAQGKDAQAIYETLTMIDVGHVADLLPSNHIGEQDRMDL